ncbi:MULTISPECIES: hypothetical protein [unclassified Streptomyces]|uniref:hypothetical protein n=1 Tax=unclassified Streptomyces TaxID=2593676 RepID=UPI0006AEEE42|nr:MULTISPECIES: hypothetical protein [unclassified Streptomyces]KOU26591.1 hypothetical protein ADK49_03525 [Streptomyces sp. WM6349]KOV47300.1 hypothetical protein ADK98_11280 [Streptomyces sp. H036]
MTYQTPSYAPPDSLQGLLQRGRGLGHLRALADPAAAAPYVYDCIRQERRWDSQCDARAHYHARLLRDLGLPIGPLLDQLAGDEEAVWRASGVLELLALAGDGEAAEGLRDYVRHGEHWVGVLESIASEWPRAWWEGLRETALERITGEEEEPGAGEPWEHFGITRDAAARQRPQPDPDRERLGTDALLALIAEPGTTAGDKVGVLRLLAGRGPRPGLIPLVPLLGFPGADRPLPGVRAALRRLGARAVPEARAWARDERPWLAALGREVLDDHPDPEALPGLLRELADLRHQEEWCGPDVTARRLAHLGPQAADAVPPLRALLLETPHSYERADYLRAIAAIDPGAAEDLYKECLWDCEERTLLIAVAAAPAADPEVRARVVALRDDPLEDPDVRAAAAERAEGLADTAVDL